MLAPCNAKPISLGPAPCNAKPISLGPAPWNEIRPKKTLPQAYLLFHYGKIPATLAVLFHCGSAIPT